MDRNGGKLCKTKTTAKKISECDSKGTSFADLKLNTITTGSHNSPAIAKLQNGGFIVTWQGSPDSSTSNFNIYGQIFDNSGSKLCKGLGLNYVKQCHNSTDKVADLFINTYTADNQSSPVVTGLTDGGFIVVWNSFGQDNTNEKNNSGVYARVFDANGKERMEEYIVNDNKVGNQLIKAIGSLSNGNAIVNYSDNDTSISRLVTNGNDKIIYYNLKVTKDVKGVVTSKKIEAKIYSVTSTTKTENYDSTKKAVGENNVCITKAENAFDLFPLLEILKKDSTIAIILKNTAVQTKIKAMLKLPANSELAKTFCVVDNCITTGYKCAAPKRFLSEDDVMDEVMMMNKINDKHDSVNHLNNVDLDKNHEHEHSFLDFVLENFV